MFFLKQKTAYEMRSSDWSSDVCSSDLTDVGPFGQVGLAEHDPACFAQPRDQGCVAACPVFLECKAAGGGRPLARLDVVLHQHCTAFEGQLRVADHEMRRASCRERVCHFVSITVVAVSLKKKKHY